MIVYHIWRTNTRSARECPLNGLTISDARDARIDCAAFSCKQNALRLYGVARTSGLGSRFNTAELYYAADAAAAVAATAAAAAAAAVGEMM